MTRNQRLMFIAFVGCVAVGIAWLSDERNRIAIEGGYRTLADREAVLGVREGMLLHEAVTALERRGLTENVSGYHPTDCDGVGVMGHELRQLDYEHHGFDDHDRWPSGGACLLAREGRVVRMEAYYVFYTPL